MKITKGLKLVIAGGVFVGMSFVTMLLISMIENTELDWKYAILPGIFLLGAVISVIWGIIKE
ncbi:hypothetical protein JW962_01390 [Candidatus Dojkabacteria bacterium]|nr:hypothetical protein [Candidatus Dojkabacteria bacterium]